MTPDVLIAGAGPVGLTLACDLARYGVSIRIVDAATRATDKSKAIVVWPRTLELLDRVGCSAAFLAAGSRCDAARITSSGKEIVHVAFDAVPSPHPFALMLPQSETERLLAEHLASLGVAVDRNVTVADFDAQADAVRSTLRHADGRTETVTSRWLVGCDGAHSTVRHQLGLAFHGETLLTDWMLADVHLRGMPTPPAIRVMLTAVGLLAIFPLSANRYRVVADIGTSPPGAAESAARPAPTLADVQRVLDQRAPDGIRASDPVWLSTFRINERKIADYRVGRVFLAGDAAHIHSPAGGQGMNTGIQDACNLAWKLALVAHGLAAPEPLLESYSRERSRIGEQVLRNAGRMTRLALFRNPLMRWIRDRAASLIMRGPIFRRRISGFLTELSVCYPSSPLSEEYAFVNEGPEAGARAPIRAGEQPVGAGERPRFALFAAESDAATALIARLGAILEPTPRAPFNAEGLWLVRPDGYVGLAAGRDDWARAAWYLERFSVTGAGATPRAELGAPQGTGARIPSPDRDRVRRR